MKNKKKILFVHQNFPAQYKHIAHSLSRNKDYEVHTLSITEFKDSFTTNHHYKLSGNSSKNINQWAIEFESKMIRAGSAADKAIKIRDSGFIPDLIIGHPGWGETFFLREIWPNAKLITYVEFYYKTKNCDIDFDLELVEKYLEKDFQPYYEYNKLKLAARNAFFSSVYSTSDYLVCPTEFQKNHVPKSLRDNIKVIHDGIDTDNLQPDLNANVTVNDKVFSKNDKIISYVSRALDPYRGFHIFMRSLPKILMENPDAYVFIVGDPDHTGYGAGSPKGRFKDIFFSEIKDKVDTERVFFFGRVEYEIFIKIMQITTVHIYLTYPFVLSWSVLEAMSCGALVIGSNTEPVTEVIKDKKNGLLVDFFDDKKLSLLVTKVLKNVDNYQHIKENARDTIVKNYDLRTICLPQQLSMIEEALK